MNMQLTQKETMLLQDLKSQEQLCIDKYNKYAEQARDEQLKQLFSSIEQTEKETISLLLDMAEASGMDDPSAFTVTIDGRRYGVITKHYYNIKAENKDAAFAALRELGLGDIITDKFG